MARTTEKANDAKQQVAESFAEGDSSRIVPLACDVSSLNSVREFSKDLREKATDGIDVLCLNAGICTAKNSKVTYTEDDLELTVATNHFGPFLLVNRIVDLMKSGGRVVVTASEVQNMKPDGSYPTFGNFVGMKDENGKAKRHFAMIDGTDFHYFKAYQMSKLCNVTFTKELNRRIASRNIVANCFSPGFMPQTGLFRNQNRFFMPMLQFFANHVMRFGETTEWGASCLAYMATDENTGKTGGQYWCAPSGVSRKGGTLEADFKPIDVNPEAIDEDNQKTLWKLSCEIVGVEQDAI